MSSTALHAVAVALGLLCASGAVAQDHNLGASAIWLARPAFNALVEVVWLGGASGDELIVSPGIRWAYNLRNGLQIVPGLAYAFDVGAFVYLSFEHPFGSTVH